MYMCLMEKLGGGRHRDIAGAQLKDISLEEAYDNGKRYNRDIFKEEE